METIAKYLKPLKNTFVYDYKKIDDEGFPINIIIAERGAKGKTYGIKSHIYNKYLNNKNKHPNKIPCLWLRSLSDDAQNECKNFLGDLPENMYQDVEQLTAETNNTGGVIKKDGEPIFTFKPVSTPRSLKGTRRLHDEVVWDEFNDSIKYFSKDLVTNLMNIISSADNPNERNDDGTNNKKLWLLGNNRGLNHPLLIDLGIDRIDGEVTKLYDDNGNKFILLLCPIYNDEQIKQINEQNKNDWLFQLNKRVGTADEIYFNKHDIDSLNYIYRYVELETEDKIREILRPRSGKLTLHSTYLINGQYLNLYSVPEAIKSHLKTEWHVINLTLMCNYLNHGGVKVKPKDYFAYNREGYLIHTTNKLELEEGIKLVHNDYKQSLKLQMGNSNISFENQTSRSNFLDLIRK